MCCERLLRRAVPISHSILVCLLILYCFMMLSRANSFSIPVRLKPFTKLYSSSSSVLKVHPSASCPRVVFILGGPGAGKGTQCERLANEFGMIHLSAGELLRNEMNKPNSAFGKLINDTLQEGKIVPVRITLDLIKQELLDENGQSRCNRYLIDGFPRNLDNLQGWEAAMQSVCLLEKVLFITVNEEESIRRILHRGQTSGRNDDNIISARKRFQTYYNSTLPIVEHYERLGYLAAINGDGDADSVYESVRSVIVPCIEQEIIDLTQQLLDAISRNEFEAYRQLVHPTLHAIEPESNGEVVTGLEFHKQIMANAPPSRSVLTNPQVQVFGKTAIISYKRHIENNEGVAIQFAESRVWQLLDHRWQMVHFHRSSILTSIV